jgi:hypothetical protein
MRQIDELHLNYPFAGSRMLRDLLGHQGLGWAAVSRGAHRTRRNRRPAQTSSSWRALCPSRT